MAEEDMIFGKNRHLFGGIEPSNMKVFSVVENAGAKPNITATLPTDTVIEGQTLCTVAGAVIRRKSSGYPKNEFDGELVSDISTSTVFTDESADVNGTYYYAAFPYTTQGVYNRNPISRGVFNEPKPMETFTSRLVFDVSAQKSHVEITATLPNGAAGAIIRKSAISYPVDENDGEEFRRIVSSTVITDTDVVNENTYYYSAFPYTSTGNYNRDTANRTSCKVVAAKAPDDMKAFTAVCTAVEQVTITGTLPDSSPSENCIVEGAYILRKTEGYPINESDGQLVTTLKSSGSYVDSNLVGDTIYYYAAFPYSTASVINRNNVSANQASCKALAAVAPGDMKVFTAVSEKVGEIKINATLPDNTLNGGVVTSVVSGAKIRKSTTGFPANENEGTLLQDLKSSGTIVDTDVVKGQTYYYAAFPYSDKGLYNRTGGSNNQTSVQSKNYEYYYGYDLTISEPEPSTRVTYPSDVDNAKYTPAKMNFDSGIFDYGGWPSTPGEKFMPRPCMLTYDGVVDHYLNPNDYTQKADGGDSKVADADFGGNAMIEWPKIYTKRWEDGGIYHFRMSDVKLDSDYECWCNYDRLNNEIDHFYTPIYLGFSVNNRLRSISGVTPTKNQMVRTQFDQARANGDDWTIEIVADRLLINDLLTMMGKSTNSQAVYGFGTTFLVNTGAGNTKGMFYGTERGDGPDRYVKVFGMENYWGGLFRRVAGWIADEMRDFNTYIKITRGTKDGTTVSDFSTSGDGYMPTNKRIRTSGVYITECDNTKYGRFPAQTSNSTPNTGSSTTYECDAHYYSHAPDV